MIYTTKSKILFKIIIGIVVVSFTTTTFTWALSEKFNINNIHLRQRSASERSISPPTQLTQQVQIVDFTKERIREFGEQIPEIERRSVFEEEGLWSIERFLEDKRESTGALLEGKWEFSSLAVYEGRPVGYIIGIRGNRDYPYSIGGLFVFRFAVHPDFRGQGVGTILLHILAQKAASAGIKEISLETWSENKEAQRLYERVGFKRTGSHFNERKQMEFFEYIGATGEIYDNTLAVAVPQHPHYKEIQRQGQSIFMSSILRVKALIERQ